MDRNGKIDSTAQHILREGLFPAHLLSPPSPDADPIKVEEGEAQIGDGVAFPRLANWRAQWKIRAAHTTAPRVPE